MWIKSLENADDMGSFETLSEIERRGFIVDRENIYLVDSSKINIGGGQMEYKALVLAALLGYTAGDIDPEHYTQLTFEQKLDRLRKAFVDPHTGELRISGSYMAIAQSTLMGPTNSS